jgi:hypothetical protein
MSIQISAKHWLQAACILVLLPFGSIALSSDFQSVSVCDASIYEDQVSFDICYEASNYSTGLGLRIHYDSSALTLIGTSYVLTNSLLDADGTPAADSSNFDGNDATDTYIDFSWASLFGGWPSSLHTQLVTINFTFDPTAVLAGECIQIEFSTSSNAYGFEFIGGENNIFCKPPAPNPPLICPDEGSAICTKIISPAIAGSIDHDSGPDQTIYTASVIGGSSISYSLADNSDPALAINSETGTVTLLENPNWLNQTDYQFTVQVTDAVGNSDSRAVILYVDPPSPPPPATQMVYVSRNPVASMGQQVAITATYAGDESTTGLGLRMHYDSSALTLTSVYDVFANSPIDADGTPAADTSDLDGNTATDTYIDFAWASLFGWWPGSNPLDLFTATFDVAESIESSLITFSASSTAAGHEFIGGNYTLMIVRDSDGDGFEDHIDAFPDDPTEWIDSDQDGIGNNADNDDDNDGVLDWQDAFPLDPSESVDTDSDGIGNNADTDDDNDNVPDNEDQDPLDPTIGRPTQIISVLGDPFGVIGNYTSVDIGYNTSNGNNQLPGLGFRIHYSSEFLSLIDAVDIFPEDLIVSAEGPFPDSENYDNDESTDLYISVAWASLYGNWPNMELPTKLLTLNFNISETIDTDTATLTDIKFSKISTPWGYDFEPLHYEMDILAATWDFDGNGKADALTDGLILLRYAFGLRGEIMTESVIAPDATMTSSEVELAVNNALVIADIDGDAQVDALSDGLLLLRYLFGLEGESLINGIISTHATRTSVQEIEQHLDKYMPSM